MARDELYGCATRAGVVRPVRISRSGSGSGPTPDQARGPNWIRTSHGYYVPADTDRGSPEQRIIEASVVLPEYGGVTGWASLRWHGGGWFDGRRGRTLAPVALAVAGDDVREQAGIRVSQERLNPRDLTEHDGVRVTTPVRPLCFEARYAESVREAVVAIDMAAFDDLVSIDELTAYALAHPGWTGIPQCRDAILLADENSWSPWETRMRLIWMLDAGLPRPLCNTPVFDRSGRHIGTPDLLDVEAGMVGEYDGALHLEGAQRARDVRREERFRAHGLEYVTMLASDMSQRGHLVDRMLSARRRAGWRGEGRRRWTVTPPAWWTSPRGVEGRRAKRLRQPSMTG